RPGVRVDLVGQHAYTDWPHLKRRAFHDLIGPYQEGTRMWESELDFSRRVNAQTTTLIGDIDNLDAFRHIGQAHSYNWSWHKWVAAALEHLPAGRAVLSGLMTARKLVCRGRTSDLHG